MLRDSADITDIKTYNGFSYLAIAIDLLSQHVVDCSFQSRLSTELFIGFVYGYMGGRTSGKRQQLCSYMIL